MLLFEQAGLSSQYYASMVLSDDRHPGPPCPTGPDGTLKPSLALNEPVVQGEVVQQPVPTVAYAAPYHPGGVPPASFNAIPPPGGAPGGRWTTDKYMGPFSWIIGLVTCCCLCFMCMCPASLEELRYVIHANHPRRLPVRRAAGVPRALGTEASTIGWRSGPIQRDVLVT